jgi:signal transduction histidine kinase
VWLTAQLMFADAHDLLLATILLIYASGIAITFGIFFAVTFTKRLRMLEEAANHYAEGDFEYQVQVTGTDEIARLADSFNGMALKLGQAESKKKELERLRRDLVAWTSHDLQTPLASVQAIIEALADGMIEDPEMEQRYLVTAQKDIRSLSLLIDDLFQLAQIDAGGLQLACEWSSISDLVSDTIESFQELAEKQGVQVRGLADKDVDPVYMDTLKIGRVLNNLLSNALRYTPEGGEVEVYVRRESRQIYVEVVDNGMGIEESDLPHLFERFYRGDKSRSRMSGGSGLGLAISKGIIEAHGGKIGVESLRGMHTKFWFYLPVQDDPLNFPAK